jgi:site-specific recombinase XerD
MVEIFEMRSVLDRVAKLMGHKDLSPTAIYTTPSRADLAAAVEKLAWQD